MKITLYIMIILLGIVSCSKEEIVDLEGQDNLDAIIESEYKKFQMPGVAYASVKEDSVVYSGAMGYANVEEKIPLTIQTRMKIASVSKTIVGTAIMQLFEDNLVELEGNISNYLPFEVKNPNYPETAITVNMLLTHTSSINDGLSHELILFGGVDYPEPLISFLEGYLTPDGQYYAKSNFYNLEPGTKANYSNHGIALLACIVEQVSGTDFNSYCKENIFDPLGMNRTTWLYAETPQDELAIPYFSNYERNPSKPFYSTPTYPDGGLMTTVEDLSKFLRAYMAGGTFGDFTLLQSETIELMLSSQTKMGDTDQGLIFTKIKRGNIELYGHDGGAAGVAAEMYFDRNTITGYIVFINRTMFCSYPTIGNALLQFARDQF